MIIRTESLESLSSAVELASEVVAGGGIVLSPTDTVYGLACDPFNPAALERLLKIKERSPAKGFLLLVSSVEWVSELTQESSSSYRELLREVWPGPVTVLLKAALQISPVICGREGKIGLRVPRSSFLLDWMQHFGGPLVSTSANLSGSAQPQSVGELREIFEDKVDLFIDGGPPPDLTPSTVVDLTETPPRILRRGSLADRIEELLASMNN